LAGYPADRITGAYLIEKLDVLNFLKKANSEEPPKVLYRSGTPPSQSPSDVIRKIKNC
jgi:hypothetical protein